MGTIENLYRLSREAEPGRRAVAAPGKTQDGVGGWPDLTLGRPDHAQPVL